MSEQYNHYLQLLNYYEGFIRQCESGNHPHNSDPLYHLIRSKQARLKRMQILSYLEELESSWCRASMLIAYYNTVWRLLFLLFVWRTLETWNSVLHFLACRGAVVRQPRVKIHIGEYSLLRFLPIWTTRPFTKETRFLIYWWVMIHLWNFFIVDVGGIFKKRWIHFYNKKENVFS